MTTTAQMAPRGHGEAVGTQVGVQGATGRARADWRARGVTEKMQCGPGDSRPDLARPGPSPVAATPMARPASCSGRDRWRPPALVWTPGTGSEGLTWDGIAGRRGVVCDHGLPRPAPPLSPRPPQWHKPLTLKSLTQVQRWEQR